MKESVKCGEGGYFKLCEHENVGMTKENTSCFSDPLFPKRKKYLLPYSSWKHLDFPPHPARIRHLWEFFKVNLFPKGVQRNDMLLYPFADLSQE